MDIWWIRIVFLVIVLMAVGLIVIVSVMDDLRTPIRSIPAPTFQNQNSYSEKKFTTTCREVDTNSPVKYFPVLTGNSTDKTTHKYGVPAHYWSLGANHEYLDHISYILNPSRACHHDNSQVHIVFLTSTAVKSATMRRAVRTMWAGVRNHNGKRIVHLFFVGTSKNETIMKNIFEESRIHGDIIMINRTDSYHLLTVKTLLMLRWSLRHCNQAKYVIRATDDIIFSYRKLFFALDTLRPNNLYFGCSSAPMVKFRFPSFANGYFVLVSMNMARDMFLLGCKTNNYFPDDIYLGMLAVMLGYPPVGLTKYMCVEPQVSYEKFIPSAQNKRDLKDPYSAVFIVHMGSSRHTVRRMKTLWKELGPSLV